MSPGIDICRNDTQASLNIRRRVLGLAQLALVSVAAASRPCCSSRSFLFLLALEDSLLSAAPLISPTWGVHHG